MKPRLNAYQVAPDTMKALGALETHVQGSGLEESLIELVKTPGVAAQRLCVLHQHAHPGRAQAG